MSALERQQIAEQEDSQATRHETEHASSTTEQTPETTPDPAQSEPGVKGNAAALLRAIDRLFPNYRTADDMAFAVAKRTPLAVVICFTLLFASLIGSFLHIAQVDFLWGIPALGALCLGLGFWIWTSSLIMRSDISTEARDALKRAIRLQWAVIAGGGLIIAYFLGMAAGLW